MVDVKPLGVPLQPHVRLSKDDCPKDDDAANYMKNVPDASACGSTRPDISHAVGFVSRFMANPCRARWEAIKSILRYYKGTKDKCLCYRKGPLELKGFCHSEMAGDAETQVHKWLCYILAGGAISWWSRLQRIVAPSTTDVEYISATEASKKAI